MRTFLRKWLGIRDLEQVTKSEVETMLAEHFKQVQEFFEKPETPKVEEKKPVPTRARNFSQFRDKVESAIFSED